jgi:hypothetical protein
MYVIVSETSNRNSPEGHVKNCYTHREFSDTPQYLSGIWYLKNLNKITTGINIYIRWGNWEILIIGM